VKEIWMNADQRRHLERMREIHHQRLMVLEEQAAQLGNYVPPHVPVEIKQLQDKVREIDAQLLVENPVVPPHSAIVVPQEEDIPVNPLDLKSGTTKVPITNMQRKHVFLSYVRENIAEVRRLHDDLITAGENVWWDQDILGGQNWKLEVRRAMQSSYAVVVCLSQELQARSKSGVYPEISDAIDAYRQYAPGSVFLIPIRLSECDIPPIMIDATRSLDSLQYVDLFPDPQRAAGLASLIRSIRAAPDHP
jgi:hypothetical protein